MTIEEIRPFIILGSMAISVSLGLAWILWEKVQMLKFRMDMNEKLLVFCIRELEKSLGELTLVVGTIKDKQREEERIH